jgi:hypothetical protein
MLDSGSRKQEVGARMQNAGCRILAKSSGEIFADCYPHLKLAANETVPKYPEKSNEEM